MKKLLCVLLALGLVGCSSSSKSEEKEVVKDEAYYLDLLQNGKVESAGEEVLVGVEEDETSIQVVISTNEDDDNVGFCIETDDSEVQFFLIGDDTYLMDDVGDWYILEDDTYIGPSMRESMNLDYVKEQFNTIWDDINEFDGEVTEVESDGDNTIVYCTNSDGTEATLTFDADTDKITGFTMEEDGATLTMALQDVDWESEIKEEAEDGEVCDEETFYSACYDAFEAVGLY